MEEFDLVITLTTVPTKEQLEMTESFVNTYKLANPEARVMVITPRPPRG